MDKKDVETRKFNIIVAIDKKNGIGNKGKLPWNKIPADIHYFRQITTTVENSKLRNVVIMCRGTFDSIGSKPLIGRINIIVSKSEKYKNVEGLISVTSFNEALKIGQELKDVETIWVIGGEGVYKEAVLHKDCNKLYITHINETYECDRFFPQINIIDKSTTTEIDMNIWKIEYSDTRIAALTFNIYSKI